MSRRWVVLAAALVGVVVTARLGWWQLDRAAEKKALQTALDAGERAAPLPASALLEQPMPLHRKVKLRGEWLADHTVFLDNRHMQGRSGFFAVTPLKLEGRDEFVLVQRGWLPVDPRQHDKLPQLETPAGLVDVEGRVAATPSRAYQLGEAGAGSIRQNLDPAAYARETGLKLLPLAVWQTAGADSLPRDWPAPDLGLSKHYGYAFQWFALAALILGLYVWFQVLRPRNR
ncbi:SURF1 family protein [Pelomonas sp. SE-A7]|uniref:SURF1 family protein n=1 Tax=Pelomonas sp. SE-A7 TaxID=3054953 RepID=UPI00259D069B|nr:SURF1 family protein [Pelomonas sp. SE-A7]MDM4767582.1 SURF1 family protein [Pelomonas sp. SE-A7]